jgi:flagellar protein FliS
MQPSAPDNYLATEVMTAPPQKLQLMLIEAAIRFAEQARAKWHTAEDDQAAAALSRAQQIVGELLSSLNHDVDPELVRKVASVYLFVFRRLMEANYQRSESKLDDALRVLRVEQETWAKLCRQLPSQQTPDNEPPPGLSLEA